MKSILQSASFRLAAICFAAVTSVGLAGCSSPETRAQTYYESGAKLLAEHNYAVAAIQFRNAVRLKADLLPAWRGLAEAEQAAHQLNGIVSVYQTILELDPKDDGTRLKLASLLLLSGAADQSLKLANQISKQDSNSKVLALKAAIYLRLKDYDTASRDAQAARNIEPDNPDAAMVLASIRLNDHDAKGALQLLSTGSLAQSKELGIELLKLRIYQQLKDYPHVESLLKDLVAQNPKEVAFPQDLVRLYMVEHRPQDAEAELRSIVAIDPKNPSPVLELVRFLSATKGPAVARQELVTQIKAGGDVLPYQLALAEFDFEQGNIDQSFTLLEKLAQSKVPADAIKAKVKLAQLKLRQKKFDDAEKVVNDVLASDTQNVDALMIRGAIRLNRGDSEGAISDLRGALNGQPHSPQLMLLLANAYEHAGSVDLADKQYIQAIKVSNYDVQVGLNYVAFLRRHGSTDRAYDFLTELVNRQPTSVAALSALAELKLARQDWAGAQEIVASIRRLGQADAVADEILGAALSGEHKYDASIAAFQSAVTAAPTAAQPMHALVQAMLRAKQNDRAITFLDSVLKDNPNNADAYVLLGNVYIASKRPDEAEKNFKAAMEKQPKEEVGYRALAVFYASQKHYDAALQTLRTGLKQLPNNAVLQLTMAGIMEAEGDYDGAISEYETMWKEEPGSAVVANNLASLLADHRTDKGSLAQARTLAATLQNSPVPQFKDTLGWVDYLNGDTKAALPLLTAAAAAMPNVALVRYHLGMVYLSAGQAPQGTAALKEALSLQPSTDLQSKIDAALRRHVSQ